MTSEREQDHAGRDLRPWYSRWWWACVSAVLALVAVLYAWFRRKPSPELDAHAQQVTEQAAGGAIVAAEVERQVTEIQEADVQAVEEIRKVEEPATLEESVDVINADARRRGRR